MFGHSDQRTTMITTYVAGRHAGARSRLDFFDLLVAVYIVLADGLIGRCSLEALSSMLIPGLDLNPGLFSST